MKIKTNVKTLARSEIDAFLKSRRVGVLSMTDGKAPYAIPLAYMYDGAHIYLTMASHGRKAGYFKSNTHVCFTVFWTPEDFGSPGKMSYTSVVLDGELVHIVNPDEITRILRMLETRMGYPAGAMDKLLEMTLKQPEMSNFWRINVTQAGGKGVEDFKEEFSE